MKPLCIPLPNRECTMYSWLPLLAALPGLVVCYVVVRRDKYDREPIVPLLLCFAAGGAITVPTVYIERWGFMQLSGIGQQHWPYTLLLSFVVIALNEEGLKFLLVRLMAFPKPFFNEPLDGIVYAAMVAMGFATVENMVYADRFGLTTALVRALTAVPAHLVFSIVQGYHLGMAKFAKLPLRKHLLVKGLVFAILLHGSYDWLILQRQWQWLSIFATVSLYISLYFANRLFQEQLDKSPFRQ